MYRGADKSLAPPTSRCILFRGENISFGASVVIYSTSIPIKGRISLGNRAFHANKDLFKSKLLTKKSKLRMYQTLVRPVVTYACETWVLKGKHKNQIKGIRKEGTEKNLRTH